MTEEIYPPTGYPSTSGQGPSEPAVPRPGPGSQGPGSRGGTSGSDTKAAAKQEASEVADTAKDDAREVGDTAKQAVQRTTDEAQRQAKDLLRQSQSELAGQIGGQQERLAGGLRSFSAELGQMADGAQQEGMASHLVRWVADKTETAGTWLEDREPADVLNELSRFARRHPGRFMLAAAAVGLIAGRVGRSLRDEAKNDDEGSTSRAGVSSGSRPSTTSRTAGVARPSTTASASGTPPLPPFPEEPDDVSQPRSGTLPPPARGVAADPTPGIGGA